MGLFLYIGYFLGIHGGMLGTVIELVGLVSVIYLAYTFIAGKFRKKS